MPHKFIFEVNKEYPYQNGKGITPEEALLALAKALADGETRRKISCMGPSGVWFKDRQTNQSYHIT